METFRKAKSIIQKLNQEGYVAYFAGGWVRDFLLDLPSDDIDIATNANPEIIQKTFKNTVPIGIAFGIILVLIEDEEFEVATFRKDISYQDGRRPSKIAFTDAIEDANRRDFTINGLFYNPINDEIMDFVDGKNDISKKIIKAIGDPDKRFKEDRLRMIRAIRLSCRLNFTIEKNTKEAILKHAKELRSSVAIERIWNELYKMSSYKGFDKAILKLYKFNLLQEIFPILSHISFEELEKKASYIELLPKDTPVIGKILELFTFLCIEEIDELCKYLKLSNAERHFALFLTKTKDLFSSNKTFSLSIWAHFYADPLSSICINIYACHLPNREKEAFEQLHLNRIEELKTAIHRIKTKNPIIRSSDLLNLGILPSKLMGELLKEAENISINFGVEDKNKLLKLLRNSEIWPKETGPSTK